MVAIYLSRVVFKCKVLYILLQVEYVVMLSHISQLSLGELLWMLQASADKCLE